MSKKKPRSAKVDRVDLNAVKNPRPSKKPSRSSVTYVQRDINEWNPTDGIARKHPDGCFDMIFADPPYFLSNGGITCHAGKMVKVDKGNWDKSRGPELNHEFNTEWLRRCQKLLSFLYSTCSTGRIFTG